jgi:hypothetical protein
MKKTDNYAGNQIRLFLGELKNGTHVNKMKAVQHFQTYIKTYQPNVSYGFSFLSFKIVTLLPLGF